MKYCKHCGYPMELYQSGETYFLRCSAFPECRYIEKVPDHYINNIEELRNILYKKAPNRSIIDIEDTLQLGKEQLSAFNRLERSNDNIFITGRAGTGKSVLLRYFVRHTSKRVIVLAPTGVAAMNVNGQTLHSFFAFDHSALDPKDVWINDETAKILKHTDAFIIDEISMVRSDIMECVNRKFQIALKNNKPFGGVQFIAFGDLYQLEPVIADPEVRQYLYNNFGGAHFFYAPVTQLCNLSIYELRHIYRQKDEHFQDLLSDIRTGNPSKEIIDEINNQTRTVPEESNILTVATTNGRVDTINNERLNALSGEQYAYTAELSGNLRECIHYTSEILKFKVGSQVMLLRNNWKDGKLIWANGTLAIVVKLTKDEIWVSINNKTYKVEQVTWDTRKHTFDEGTGKITTETIARFTQYPLCLAWATTIHKAQGKTFQRIIVDFGRGAFSHGQAYVALSRCESLNGLYLVKPLMRRDIIVNPVVSAYMHSANIENEF